MFGFVIGRLALVVPTFIGVTLLAFSLIHLIPGDPVETMSGERGMEPERYQRLLHEFDVVVHSKPENSTLARERGRISHAVETGFKDSEQVFGAWRANLT